MDKNTKIYKQFKNAVLQLEEVLAQEKNEFIRDSAIKRFEIAFDLSWKAIKSKLEEDHGVRCASPKSCLREAYNQKIIENYEDFWIELADWRNKTVHIYDENLAEEVYSIIPKAFEYFKMLSEKLK